MQEKGFIFDYAKCVGCHACIVACNTENKTEPPISWRQVNTYNPKKIPLDGYIHLSLACNHCIEAPCINACPAKAYERDNSTGAIIHHNERCIGCRYCTWACPFDAPKYNSRKGVIEKCHLCNHRLKDGLNPACANLCPTGALSFGSIEINGNENELGINIKKIKPRVQTLRSDIVDRTPEMDIKGTSCKQFEIKRLEREKNKSKIESTHEWPLVLFTLIYSYLVGWIYSLKNDSLTFLKVIFILLAFIGVLLSTFHLGKPIRSYRSILNLKTSWLSREIFLCGLFNLSAFIYLFVYSGSMLGIIASIIGLLFLISVEMVYSITIKRYKTPIHSANTILTAVLFALLFFQQWWYLVVLLSVKASLYLVRNVGIVSAHKSKDALLALTRIILGFILPVGIVCFMSSRNYILLLLVILIGEAIDRFQYYNDLLVDTPALEMLKKQHDRLVEKDV